MTPRTRKPAPTDTPATAAGSSRAPAAGTDGAPSAVVPKPVPVGRLVDYETTDPVTGAPISGVGLLVSRRRGDDGKTQLLVAPLTVLGIYLGDDAIKAR